MTPEYIAVIAVCACAALALLIWFVIFSNNALTVSEYGVEDSAAPEKPVKIVHLSDLHGKSFGKGNIKLVRAVEKLKPDIIAFTGDAIHKYRERDIKVALALFERLVSIAPVVYVSGNHEMRNKGYSKLRERLKDAGVQVLDDERVEVCGLTVAGLNCASLKNNTAFKVVPQQGFSILLAHEPQYLINYSRAGASLVLCGHAHGGQWRVPFTGIGIYSPGQGLFPKLTSGRHMCGSTQMIISRGLGNSEFPLRLFNRPEIVSITILRK